MIRPQRLLPLLLAAAMVTYFGVAWPDRIVGIAIALLFLRTSATVIREARSELSGHPSTSTGPLVKPGSRLASTSRNT